MKHCIFGVCLALLCNMNMLWAQSSETLLSYLTPIEDWKINRELIEVFNEDNLFERINGAAPGYFAYHFEEMTSVDYQKGDQYITIQAYRHASENDAFGIYSAERAVDATFLPIGVEAYRSDALLNFVAGRIYVKIQSPSTSADVIQAVEKIAKNLADKISSNPTFPPTFSAFPTLNKKDHSEQFISTKFLGHEFLSNAFVVSYTQNTSTYKLFIIEGKNEAEIKQMLTNYFTFTKQPLEFNPGKLVVKDRFNGDVPLEWKGKYLWGIQNDWGIALDSDAILNQFSQSISRQGLH